jgi:hypothetical protein
MSLMRFLRKLRVYVSYKFFAETFVLSYFLFLYLCKYMGKTQLRYPVCRGNNFVLTLIIKAEIARIWTERRARGARELSPHTPPLPPKRPHLEQQPTPPPTYQPSSKSSKGGEEGGQLPSFLDIDFRWVLRWFRAGLNPSQKVRYLPYSTLWSLFRDFDMEKVILTTRKLYIILSCVFL